MGGGACGRKRRFYLAQAVAAAEAFSFGSACSFAHETVPAPQFAVAGHNALADGKHGSVIEIDHRDL